MNVGYNKSFRAAFTLVEILAVITIAGILLALVLGLQGKVKEKMVQSRIETEMAALQLALESYKSKKGNYPQSSGWNDSYPSADWTHDPSSFPINKLYSALVEMPLKDRDKPFLPDVNEQQHDGNGTLLVFALENAEGTAQWYYNALDPQYNKNTYDLWVEYGDYGDDGQPGGGDDVVKIISNWQ